MGVKATGGGGGGGEIVQVQGGHIIRATGRKDRHSKVFTAKGPRDRRVRLAAHTAIQFYDVQDRLGYDRPSKAVDWLINKAKASIDKLAELPPWDPIASHNYTNNNHNDIGVSNQMCLGGGDANDNNSGSSSQFYVPHCVDSQTLGGSMKSFFPTNDTSHDSNNNNNNNNNNNAHDFQNYPHDLISRETHHTHQDLCLSLHSLNDPGGGASTHNHHHHAHPGHDQALFQGGFDGGWAHHHDVGRFTRLMGWVGDSGGSSVGGEGRGGILFNTNPPQLMSTQALLMSQQGSTIMPNYSQNNQRGTLQSSYSSLTRVFEDNPSHNNHSNNSHHDQSISGMGHGSDSLMGFYIPSQIHGDLHATGASMSNRASSSSLSTDSTQQ